MSELRTLTETELVALLGEASATQAAASLRPDGTVRMLGQLRVGALEPGQALQLHGAKHRDQLPAAEAPVTLSLILGDQAISIHTRMLAPVAVPAQDPVPAPVLRVAWPSQALEFHHREEVRVASVDLPSLEATLVYQGQHHWAEILNLTELGLGLGLRDNLRFQPHDRVAVITALPGGQPFQLTAEVRHFECLEEDPLPVRVGLILLATPSGVREDLRRLIQARRMFFSQDLREG
jgi:hypothetical protein